MMQRRTLLAGALAAPFVARAARAQQATVLRVGNWVPPHHLIPRGILEPWARAIEAESNGSLRFEIMASAIGRPPEYFDYVVNGVVDVGWGVCGHNPGRFPMTEVMGLPFMSPDVWAGCAASWLAYARYGQRYNEQRGVKVVGLWVHSEPYLYMRSEPLRTIDDLRGKRIRVGSAFTGRIVQALGGVPIQLPPTEAQQAMQSGVADGITFPAESIEFFRITPAIRSSNRFPGGLLYTDTFWLGINEARWNALTPEQRAAIERHSGMAVAMLAGWAWTSGDEWARAAFQRSNVQFSTLPESEAPRIREAVKVLETEWLQEAQRRNQPGAEIVAYARAMAENYRAMKRVNVP